MFWSTQTKLKGLTPAIGASPNFVLPQKVLSDSNNFKTLYNRKYQCSQLLVKKIKIDGIVKMTVGLEGMSHLVLFHRTEIVRQTEITHDF